MFFILLIYLGELVSWKFKASSCSTSWGTSYPYSYSFWICVGAPQYLHDYPGFRQGYYCPNSYQTQINSQYYGNYT